MKSRKMFGLVIAVCFVGLLAVGFGFEQDRAMAADMPGFDINKMSDMSDFDPNNPVIPTGDTHR